METEEWVLKGGEEGVIERRGMEYIPLSERRGSPKQVAWMWLGGVTGISNVVFGATIVSLGLTLPQAFAIIVIGNASYWLMSVASMPGPASGTTAFGTSRAAFGPNGNRGVGVFNWATLVGYEIFGMSIVTFAILALLDKAGVHNDPDWLKVVIILGVLLLQGVIPFVGIQFMFRLLKALVLPFVVLFIILAVLAIPKVHWSAGHSAPFSMLAVALAIVISASGLSYSVNGSDYTRYLPPDANKREIVWLIALAGFVPSALLMMLGAAVATAVPTATDPISGLPHVFAGWFLIPYLICVIAQTYAGGSITLYSSGVTLQAIGAPVSRWQAMVIDTVICFGATILIVLYSAFDTYVGDFLLFTIVWLAPWCAIFIVDYFLRQGKYDSRSLMDVTSRGIYWDKGGFSVPGVVALVAGMVASAMFINTSLWEGPLTRATGGVDMSVFLGLLVGGGTYYLLARKRVRASVVIPGPSAVVAEGGQSVL